MCIPNKNAVPARCRCLDASDLIGNPQCSAGVRRDRWERHRIGCARFRMRATVGAQPSEVDIGDVVVARDAVG